MKVLANEDTLLRTHCCRHKCFPVCPRAQHLLWTQILCPGHKKMFLILFRNILCPQQMFPSLRSPRRSRATMCPQPCVLVCQYLKLRTEFFPPGFMTQARSAWIDARQILNAREENLLLSTKSDRESSKLSLKLISPRQCKISPR